MSTCLDEFDGLFEIPQVEGCGFNDGDVHICILDSEDEHEEGHECQCGVNWL